MSDNTHSNQAMTDDPELAKVLEGMNQQVSAVDENGQPVAQPSGGLQFEATANVEQPAPEGADLPTPQPTDDSAAPAADVPVPPLPEPPALDEAAAPAASGHDDASHDGAKASPELESIKKDALDELRPLVDKLDLPADEKFDTLLLIIRSTDDHALLGAAHDAAKAIEDDSKRAQALLDVIKEIDFFAHQT